MPGDTLAGELDMTSLRLQGLDPAAARALLREHNPWLTSLQERQVLDGAAGNPLALLELPLALSRAGPRTRRSGAAALPLTTRLERSFAARVRDLDPHARMVLLVAALQDSDVLAETFAAAAELAGTSTPRVSPSVAIDAAVAMGLLSVSGGSFRFRHSLVRSAIVRRRRGIGAPRCTRRSRGPVRQSGPRPGTAHWPPRNPTRSWPRRWTPARTGRDALGTRPG